MAYSRSSSTLPLGVAILSVLIGIVAVILLIAGILLVAVAGLVASVGSAALFGPTILGGILLIIFAIVLLVVALGLWRQELWALVLSIIVVLIFLVTGAVRGTVLSISWILLLLLLIYLIAVHHHFR